ncbi:hypothetical protein [Shewanella sp. POL2]|uniref:hypothetical protein n=1 Tax=Shewanella sp. POL2 TaxID=1201295 RepID=UPI0002F22B3D|nr:hypothetical protein [Shewanella sp. POL2]
MSDNVDDANALADLQLQVAMAGRKRPVMRPFTGCCYWCCEPVESPRIFCDADCRDDFERDAALKGRVKR